MTTGTLWLLSLASLGVKDVNADTAAKHAARCIGENYFSQDLYLKTGDFRFDKFDTCSAYGSIKRDSDPARFLFET